LRYQFGPFEADSTAGRLLKDGVRVQLREQPFQVLLTLLRSPGEVVTRETLRTRLWGNSTFVDFENGLNAAISRLRDALDDLAKTPAWIETVPKRGYRFIGRLPQSAAVTAYLKGHHVISPHSVESMRKALAYFEEAIALDPSYPLPYHGAALVHILRCLLDDLRPLEALAKADEYLARGLECTQKSAMVYNTLAMLRTFQRRWEEAERASQTAMDLEESNAYVRMIRAQLFSCRGQHDCAISEARKAVDLDPTHPRPHMHLTKALYYARRFEECVRAGEAGLDVCSDAYIAFYAALALIARGQSVQALRFLEKIGRPRSPQAMESAMWAFIEASAGHADEAVKVLRDLKQRRESGYVPAVAIAWLEIALKNFDSSIEWLMIALQEGEPDLASARVSPAYDPIRELPRFKQFVAQLEMQ
jgi:DNA-binding winged helix-turn-helix (wHTH) protein